MGKIGPLEIILILAVVLLMFGGRKIPELMKGIGQGLKEFKNLPPNFHQTKIMSNGDVVNSQTGQVIDNLFDFVP